MRMENPFLNHKHLHFLGKSPSSPSFSCIEEQGVTGNSGRNPFTRENLFAQNPNRQSKKLLSSKNLVRNQSLTNREQLNNIPERKSIKSSPKQRNNYSNSKYSSKIIPSSAQLYYNEKNYTNVNEIIHERAMRKSYKDYFCPSKDLERELQKDKDVGQWRQYAALMGAEGLKFQMDFKEKSLSEYEVRVLNEMNESCGFSGRNRRQKQKTKFGKEQINVNRQSASLYNEKYSPQTYYVPESKEQSKLSLQLQKEEKLNIKPKKSSEKVQKMTSLELEIENRSSRKFGQSKFKKTDGNKENSQYVPSHFREVMAETGGLTEEQIIIDSMQSPYSFESHSNTPSFKRISFSHGHGHGHCKEHRKSQDRREFERNQKTRKTGAFKASFQELDSIKENQDHSQNAGKGSLSSFDMIRVPFGQENSDHMMPYDSMLSGFPQGKKMFNLSAISGSDFFSPNQTRNLFKSSSRDSDKEYERRIPADIHFDGRSFNLLNIE